MKDMYSFNKNKEDMEAFYEKAKQAYKTIFERVGIGHVTYVVAADGSVFGDRSHEFQTLSDAGEDTIYVDEEKMVGINEEVYTDSLIQSMGLDKNNLKKVKSIEVGNIFPIETIISERLDFKFKDEDGKDKPIYMGSYGIGLGRVMGTVVEVLSDENGIVWPESIAPYKVHLVSLCKDEAEISQADSLYENLVKAGIEVLYDDRQDARAGEKFADSDLIGIPVRLIVSSKTLEKNSVEVKRRSEETATIVPVSKVVNELT